MIFQRSFNLNKLKQYTFIGFEPQRRDPCNDLRNIQEELTGTEAVAQRCSGQLLFLDPLSFKLHIRYAPPLYSPVWCQ